MAINRDKVEAAAIKLLQQGKYDKAIVELSKLVDDDPTDVRTLLKLGDTHVKLGNKKESIGAYEKAAGIYTEQGFYLKGVAVFKQILRVDANVPALHLKLAELYQQLGLTSDALQHYQNVADFHESQGRPREALEMLKRMVDLDPDNLASRIKLGELFAQQGLAAEATQELRSALGFLKTQQRFDDYVRVGEKLVQYDASALDVARDLAQIYLQRAQPSVALGKLQMCFKEEPRNVEILALIAQAFLDMQQVQKTISVFKEMAKIYSSDGKADLAQRTWERVLELSPGDVEADEALGRAPSATGKRASAPALAAPTAPTVLFPAQAAVVAAAPTAVVNPAPRRVANAETEQLQRLLTESDVYVKYGLKAKALEHLQKVFAIRSDHIPALEKSFTLLQALGGGPELKETLRRLVDAAETQGHARLDEWRAELARLQSDARAPPTPAPPPPQALLSVEADIVIVDDFPGESLVPDEPLDISNTGTINLQRTESGIMILDPSHLTEQVPNSELDSLPPDDNDVERALDELPASPLIPVAREVPRMLTGVHDPLRPPSVVAPRPIPQPLPPWRAPVDAAAPPAASARAVPPRSSVPELLLLEVSEEIIDADALVRRALEEFSAEEMTAAIPELGPRGASQTGARVSPAPVAADDFDAAGFDLPAGVSDLLLRGSGDKTAATVSAAAPEGKRAPAPSVADRAKGWEHDPANEFFFGELEESEFFIKQDLLAEAKEILESIIEDLPESGRVQWMLARVEAKESGKPEPPAPWDLKLQEQILEEVNAQLEEAGGTNAATVLSTVTSAGPDTLPEDEDAATHYELGIAYREMGLHEDAISELHIAARAHSRAADARYIIGLVRIDQGKHEDAVKAFDEAIAHPTTTTDQRGAAEYSKGLVLEELGRLSEALHAFKAAKLNANGAVDLDQRIKALVDKVGAAANSAASTVVHGTNGHADHDAKSPSIRNPKNTDHP